MRQVLLSFDRGTLLLKGLDRQEMREFFGSGVWRWDHRLAAWRCEAINYGTVRQDLVGKFGPGLVDAVPQPVRVSWPRVELPPLRPEQKEYLTTYSSSS